MQQFIVGNFLAYRMLMAACCSVARRNMHGQVPIEVAINAGHKQIIAELMKSQFALQTAFLKETDMCKGYHINIFLYVVRAKYCKVFDLVLTSTQLVVGIVTMEKQSVILSKCYNT